MTQEEIADKLHIKQNTYSQYENGLREPSIEILKQLAVLFETSVDYIVPNPNPHASPLTLTSWGAVLHTVTLTLPSPDTLSTS